MLSFGTSFGTSNNPDPIKSIAISDIGNNPFLACHDPANAGKTQENLVRERHTSADTRLKEKRAEMEAQQSKARDLRAQIEQLRNERANLLLSINAVERECDRAMSWCGETEKFVDRLSDEITEAAVEEESTRSELTQTTQFNKQVKIILAEKEKAEKNPDHVDLRPLFRENTTPQQLAAAANLPYPLDYQTYHNLTRKVILKAMYRWVNAGYQKIDLLGIQKATLASLKELLLQHLDPHMHHEVFGGEEPTACESPTALLKKSAELVKKQREEEKQKETALVANDNKTPPGNSKKRKHEAITADSEEEEEKLTHSQMKAYFDQLTPSQMKAHFDQLTPSQMKALFYPGEDQNETSDDEDPTEQMP